jgi:hypothetical protein
MWARLDRAKENAGAVEPVSQAVVGAEAEECRRRGGVLFIPTTISSRSLLSI